MREIVVDVVDEDIGILVIGVGGDERVDTVEVVEVVDAVVDATTASESHLINIDFDRDNTVACMDEEREEDNGRGLLRLRWDPDSHSTLTLVSSPSTVSLAISLAISFISLLISLPSAPLHAVM